MSVLNAQILPFKEFPVAQTVKNPPAMQETRVQSLCWENPMEGEHGNPLQYSCFGESHGHRSLEGYSV